MAALIWDNEAQAFKEPDEVPKRYAPDAGAYVETTGKAYDPDVGAWEEKWNTGTKLSELPVGTLLKDEATTYYGVPIIWKIMEHNHDGDPDNSTALVTEKTITLKCFDAAEILNSNSDRKNEGNNRWSISNIRQWLNSDAEAGKWYVAQHSADAPPISANLWQGYNPYDTEAGFLANLSEGMKSALLTSTRRVVMPTLDGDGYEDTEEKIFLLSSTEVGLMNENSIAEGSIYSLFNEASERLCYPTKQAISNSQYTSGKLTDSQYWYWRLRTPFNDSTSYATRRVSTGGELLADRARSCINGIRPACIIPCETRVSQAPDTDGVYIMQW
jgi:hypothetical protein